MKLKNILFQLFVCFLVVGTSMIIYPGVRYPDNPVFLCMIIGMLSLALSLTDSVLKFLTIKQKFLTRLIVAAALVTVSLYLGKFVANDLTFLSTTVKSIDLHFFVIKSFTIPNETSVVVAGIVVATLYSIFYKLQTNGK